VGELRVELSERDIKVAVSKVQGLF